MRSSPTFPGKRSRALSAIGLSVLGMLLVAAAAVAGSKDADASTFSATLSITVSNTGAGAQSDITSEFDIPAPNANFGAVIGFTPSGWGIGACPANDPASASASCADAPIPDGARAGRLTSDATLGLLNNPCNQPISVAFEMLDATTSAGSTTFETQFADDDGDGIPNGAESYPDYLRRILSDGSAPLQPVQRLYGQTSVGGTNVSLNFVIFRPGITLQGQQLDPNLGYPSVAVLQNTGDPEARLTPSGITDFCTPLSTQNATFGVTQDNPSTGANEAGMNYRTNPGDGGVNFTTYARSQRDADDDGIENSLDPCPFEGNAGGWDPRGAQPGPADGDGDGLPDLCDPTATHMITDQDNDAYMNRHDNCPNDVNGLAGENQVDTDADGIGNACDPTPNAGDGHFHELCLFVEIDIGAGGTPTGDPLDLPPCGEGGGPPPPAPSVTPTPTVPGAPTPTLPPGATPAPTPTPTPTPPPAPPPDGSPTAPPDGSPTTPANPPTPTVAGATQTPQAGADATPCPTPTVTAESATPTAAAETTAAAGDTGTPTASPSAPADESATPTAAPSTPACPAASAPAAAAAGGEDPKAAVAGASQLPSTGGMFPGGGRTADLLLLAGIIALTAGAISLGWSVSRRET